MSSTGQLECHICPYVCNNTSYLQTHLKFHIMKPIKCIICNSVTKHKRSFDRHLREVHKIRDRLRMDYLNDMGDPEREDSEDDEHDNELEPATKKAKYVSDDEEDLTEQEKELRRLNKRILLATKIRDTTDVTGSKKFKCDVCFKVYRQSDYLKEHKKLHDGTVAKFHCKICPSKFVIKKQFSAHMSKVHTTKIIKCTICNNMLKHVSSPSYT